MVARGKFVIVIIPVEATTVHILSEDYWPTVQEPFKSMKSEVGKVI